MTGEHTQTLGQFIEDTCEPMSISEQLVAKVTPSRIFSIDMHRSTDASPLIAAGDKWGYVGLWNVVCIK